MPESGAHKAAAFASPIAEADCVSLLAFEPDSPTHVAELRRQRVVCGWAEDHVDEWCDQVRRGDKNLLWIVTPEGHDRPADLNVSERGLGGAVGPAPPDVRFQPLGHVGLDWCDYLGDDTLANKEESTATIASFFLLPSQRGRGLGRLVMDLLEARAATAEMGVKTLTLNTIPATVQTDDYWRRELCMSEITNSDMLVNQAWYQRRGYQLYKMEERYPYTSGIDGKNRMCKAVFMRKNLAAA